MGVFFPAVFYFSGCRSLYIPLTLFYELQKAIGHRVPRASMKALCALSVLEIEQ